MTTILVAAEAAWVRDQVTTAFAGPDMQVVEVRRGQDVRGAVAQHAPDLVVLDMQIANMGGIAVAIDLRLEARRGAAPATRDPAAARPRGRPLPRQARRRRRRLVKPVDAGILRRAVEGSARGNGAGRRLTGRSRLEGVEAPSEPGPGRYTHRPYGMWRSLVSASVRDAEAPGSNPGIPTTCFPQVDTSRLVNV